MKQIPIIRADCFFEWQERCEQMYLEQAARFKERESRGDFSVVYNMNTGAIRSMSEVMLEWAADTREQIETIRRQLELGGASQKERA